MAFELYPHQEAALRKMKNGCILNGGVGSGKSITAIAYYFFKNGGIYEHHHMMPMVKKQFLVIITTARKRDTFEWNKELSLFDLYVENGDAVIDSWNNIKKYSDMKDAFFIFDEQRASGSGAWVKAFLKIAKSNEWILLSATPGDSWVEYAPVFVANGFYKNITEFKREHVVMSHYGGYPKIDRYINTVRLNKLRRSILVDMDFKRKTNRVHINVWVPWDNVAYKRAIKTRFNEETGEPFKNASALCYYLRMILNSNPDRLVFTYDILKEKKKAIIFYNFDYELYMLEQMLDEYSIPYGEWNGHQHNPIPDTDTWAYLVQYNAGSEGWNCTRCDTVIFYSQNYSYKMTEQACGRIDRLNTPYNNLYYYHLKSKAGIDLAIAKALKDKKNFNESAWTSQ